MKSNVSPGIIAVAVVVAVIIVGAIAYKVFFSPGSGPAPKATDAGTYTQHYDKDHPPPGVKIPPGPGTAH